MTFTNAVTISETDTNYDGQDIIVDGATVTIDGPHSFNSLLLTNNAVLTHSPCTTTTTHKLELFVTNTLAISTNSRIDVSLKGYLAGRTTGNTTNGAATGLSGGSYGGLGGSVSGAPNAVYGDYADPDDWGSSGHTGAKGGGLVRIRAGTLGLEGQVLANGEQATWEGSGSGGGIYIAVGTLTGGGLIQASGGVNYYGAGGGGRIAVYGGDFAGFNLSRIQAPGAVTNGAGRPGGAGTVWLLQGTPHTHARYSQPGKLAVFPTNNYALHVPIPLTNGLAIYFNKPVATNSLAANQISIHGPAGIIMPTGISEIGDRLYRFAFPPQTENGSYRFTLSQTLLDLDGFQLDQNANGIPGEPEDAYSFTLILDTVAPRITQHSPAGDVAGTITSVDIWFSEQMDTNTLSPADVTIFNPTNGAVSVSSIASVGLNRFRISFPPQLLTGQYHVLISTNVTDLAGNPLTPTLSSGGGEGVAYDATFNLVPVDLELSDIVASTNFLFSGATASVSWHGRNSSGAPLLGNWIDAVYLSPDPFWNITDPFLGTVQHTGGLASNEVYSASLNFNVPGLLPGNYYLIVRADLGNHARETSEANNTAVFGPVAVSVRELSLGGSFAGTLTPGNRLHYFALQLAPGESLRLTLNGQSGVNHLFVNHASIPTRLEADATGTTASPNQTITLSGSPSGGTYYVLVSGEQVGGNGNFTLTADTASFFVTEVSPKRVSNWTSFQTDPPLAIITITGVGFDQATTVEFIGSGGEVRLPDRTRFVSTTMLTLDLNTLPWPSGVYDVRVSKGGTSRSQTNAFTVDLGFSHFTASLVVPSGLSPGLPTRQTIWIEYQNDGNAAMVAPLLRVSAPTNVVLTSDLNTAIAARSSAAVAATLGHSVQVMAAGSGATPGILQAGDSSRIPVYYLGLRPDQGNNQVSFQLSWVKALETETRSDSGGGSGGLFAAVPTIKVRPVDWSAAAEERSRPETLAADAWNAVWQNLTQLLGPDWRNYVTALAAQMNHLAAVGQPSYEVPQLFNFEVLQATAALNPVRTLSGAVDSSAPSPGFPLVFRRVFAQPILSRYRLGPLGRGWAHNWDVSIQILTNQPAVVVHGPGGSSRSFLRQNDGSYAASASRDPGRLTLSGAGFRLIEADRTIWQFDANSRLNYVEDPNGNRITCGYTGAQLTSLTHTSGKQLLLQYNGSGRLAQLTDSANRITTYEYDGSGEHLIRVTAPGNRATTYAYHTTGVPQRLHALTNVTHPDLTQDSFAYDAQGRLIQTSQNCCGGAQQVTYAYDSAGTVTVTDATGRATQLLYGLGGQLAQVRDGEGRIVNFTYDDLAQLTQLLGPGGERYRYGYDGFGNLSGIEDPLRQNNNFTYEPNFNRLAQVRDARGNDLKYAYDNRGNLTAITYADATAERFAYDARGNVITSTNRRGGVITYAYNPAGQLTSKDYAVTPGITDFTYAYDSAGNLTNATYWNPQLATQETLNLQYDPFTDRLTRIEYPGGRFFTFDYDPAGRRARRADQDGHVTAYLYDPLGRLARMTNELGQTFVNYDYDPAGRLSRKTLGNGVFTTYTYNQAGQVTQLLNSRADSNVLSSFAYTYDASGRRDSMTVVYGFEFPLPGERVRVRASPGLSPTATTRSAS
ncbi:MAG: Ig-like domain-containing protein [Verrucomicrobiae bacterium]|nr:Ig-like domain-containing protein [Verrucomicrobiae bacterium]